MSRLRKYSIAALCFLTPLVPLLLLPNARFSFLGAQTAPKPESANQAQKAAQDKAQEYFAKARSLEHSKPMYKFSKEEWEMLLSHYESGLETLIAEAEKDPTNPAVQNVIGPAPSYLRSYANHALRKYRYDRVFDYWDRIKKIGKGARIEAVLASAMALRAHSALAEAKYEEAIRIFSEMSTIAKTESYGKLVMASYHPESYERIAKRAQVLSRQNIKPEYTAKIFSLRVGLLRFKWKEKGLAGESTTEVSTSPLKIKKGDVELADMAEASLRQTILAMSDGKFDIAFDRLALVDPLEINLPDGKKLPNGITQSPSQAGDDIIDRATGDVGNRLRERAKANDVVFLFWWGTSPLTQHGGSRNFAIDTRKKMRGHINMGVQFFHYDPGLDYMNCGSCPEPNAIGFYPHVYMHEFFHVVEARFGIKPVHGFTDPPKFPAWKGQDEVDYYWWQVRENIPAIQRQRGQTVSWTAFSFQ